MFALAFRILSLALISSYALPESSPLTPHSLLALRIHRVTGRSISPDVGIVVFENGQVIKFKGPEGQVIAMLPTEQVQRLQITTSKLSGELVIEDPSKPHCPSCEEKLYVANIKGVAKNFAVFKGTAYVLKDNAQAPALRKILNAFWTLANLPEKDELASPVADQ